LWRVPHYNGDANPNSQLAGDTRQEGLFAYREDEMAQETADRLGDEHKYMLYWVEAVAEEEEQK